MRYALILAGGSGTRLWPMSRADEPKQLIPFIQGRSLLEIAVARLEGLVPKDRIYLCAGRDHREAILETLGDFDPDRYIAEPTGRDTLNAVALGVAVIAARDPGAVVGVFTSDHVIEPVDRFQAQVTRGFELAEAPEAPPTLVTFGIEPTHAATGYGYLKLGAPAGPGAGEGRIVEAFREKPDAETARTYLEAGPENYLWNSGMFVYPARGLLDCVERYAPENATSIRRIAAAWSSPERDRLLEALYPELPKISIDYAVMEPAGEDPQVRVAAVPMPLSWLDVGSWPAYGRTLETDEAGNALSAEHAELMESGNNLVASDDPDHLVALLGCQGLVVIHTARATLVCPAEKAEAIKALHARIAEHHGDAYV